MTNSNFVSIYGSILDTCMGCQILMCLYFRKWMKQFCEPLSIFEDYEEVRKGLTHTSNLRVSEFSVAYSNVI